MDSKNTAEKSQFETESKTKALPSQIPTTETIFHKNEGPLEKQTRKKAGKTLKALQNVNVLTLSQFTPTTASEQTATSEAVSPEAKPKTSKTEEEEEESGPDPLKKIEAAHLSLLGEKNRTNRWEEEENPTEAYLQKKERARLEKLRRDRPRWIHLTLTVLFQFTVLLSFFYSCIDSFKLTMEEAKFESLYLAGAYNCMEVISRAGWMSHVVNIFHALMSACIVFAETKQTGSLCMAYVFSQLVHTCFKTFQFVMQVRFLNSIAIFETMVELGVVFICNVIAGIVVMHRYYDLTDRIRSRAKFVSSHVNEEGSMNDEIIYQNQSSFLQRKYILREATQNQVYKMIQKIEHYRAKGLEPDYVGLYRELVAARKALEDVDDVENEKLFKELRRANAKRLREIETNPESLEKKFADKLKGPIDQLLVVKFDHDIH